MKAGRQNIADRLFGQGCAVNQHGIKPAGFGNQWRCRIKVLGHGFADQQGGRGRSGEGHPCHPRIAGNRRPNRPAAGQQLQRRRRHARAVQQINRQRRNQRSLLGWFGHDGVASRKGRTTKAKPSIAVPLPPDVLATLRPLTAGRTGAEPLLTRWHNVKVSPTAENGRTTWKRDGRRAWQDSSEVSRPWRLTLAEVKLQTAGLVPYCLRHSSIVRALSAGLPVRLVAAVHDTSTAMIEKHYSAHIVDASEELLRRAMMPMASAEVASLGAEKAKRMVGA